MQTTQDGQLPASLAMPRYTAREVVTRNRATYKLLRLHTHVTARRTSSTPTWARFRVKIATTCNHPRSQVGEQVRREQVAEIVRVMNELRESERTHNLPARPLILLGDFNAVPTSPSFQALCAHLRPLDVLPCEEEWTHCTHKILIDHIFVDDPLGVLPPAKAEILTRPEVDDLSDHRPLCVRFMDASG
ncbi:MAG UNVERIFIED_CONTAM: endonuclease/exonuclease/phosphatase family protein [Anaerolineae bacterium]